MKCFTIQSGSECVADVPVVISNSYYNGVQIQTVEDVDEAKHYKNRSTPRAWLKKSIANAIEKYALSVKKLDDAKTQAKRNYYIQQYTRVEAENKEALKWLENAKVIELDMEKPNFPSDLKLRFHQYRHGNHASQMRLQKETHSRYTCKACGVILKNIPYYDLPDGNSTKICVACLYLRQEAIKSAFEGLPEDFRTQFINELVLGSL